MGIGSVVKLFLDSEPCWLRIRPSFKTTGPWLVRSRAHYVPAKFPFVRKAEIKKY